MEYSFKNETTSERDTTSLKLNFSGINVNTFTNTLPQEIQTAITVPNVEDGEADLYLKGSDGIISIINLFGPDSDENGLADELEDLRRKKWLINEANLIFYVDRDKVTGGASEPERIIIYDLKNNTILADFPLDITSGLEAEDAVTIHLGKLHRDADGNGEYYKIRITNHISNLINNAAENVPLGIIVTQNVLATRFQSLENAQSPGITGVPVGSVISHEGTVLFGNAAPDPTKRLKLQIYYTEPN